MFSPAKAIGSAGTPTLRHRVLSKIVVDPKSGCHEWAGAYSLKRRGRRPVIRLGGKGSRVVLVARLVLEWKAGPPPSSLHEAGHTCPLGENSKCVNEDHLQWQTRTENEHQKQVYQQPT